MATVQEQIKEIEIQIRETPYHKGTEHHIGRLRARLARLRDRQLEGGGGAKGGGTGYAVKKQGDATVVLIGPPSAGKSTLLNRLTNAESKVAPYAFTTVSVIPGMFKYQDAYIQILDVPGLIEGARLGKGRGKEVLSVARAADLLLIMTDVDRVALQESLSTELESSGIRINKEKPDVRVEKKTEGGITIQSNIVQELGKETIKEVAMVYGIRNADIVVKEKLTMERLIDSFSPSRIYLPALFVVNKIDEKAESRTQEGVIYLSAQTGEGLDRLIDAIWESLKLLRVYLVRPDEEPSFDHPIVMKEGDTLKDVAKNLGSDFSENKKMAKIWGNSAHFPGQEVALSRQVVDGLQIRFF